MTWTSEAGAHRQEDEDSALDSTRVRPIAAAAAVRLDAADVAQQPFDEQQVDLRRGTVAPRMPGAYIWTSSDH